MHLQPLIYPKYCGWWESAPEDRLFSNQVAYFANMKLGCEREWDERQWYKDLKYEACQVVKICLWQTKRSVDLALGVLVQSKWTNWPMAILETKVPQRRTITPEKWQLILKVHLRPEGLELNSFATEDARCRWRCTLSLKMRAVTIFRAVIDGACCHWRGISRSQKTKNKRGKRMERWCKKWEICTFRIVPKWIITLPSSKFRLVKIVLDIS